ncbi:helix-turn-helix domain-containing protein [Nonomuraea soli]|uniref:Transcriptional regulator with XRE-family HTH domain n=1 Tax=Nonomuraea soli TaxID=1032476 RepID=A0A7W0CU34_9ACTN|nr:helix-turn-helix transcriptional regulator [Nonomuraea soli]MBA2897376.1 transcriptional regulator with XRE-family HTH domain [Nonomuraea soli]
MTERTPPRIMANPHPIAAQIERLRKTKGWTQQQLADAVPCSQSLIVHWESGVRMPNLRTLEAALKALGHVLVAVPDAELGGIPCRTCYGQPPLGFLCTTCAAEGTY